MYRTAPIAALAALASPAFAQEAATTDLRVGAAGDEIVVTAQKRAENIIDVPASVAVVGEQAMESRNLVNLEDYVRALPGVTLNSQAGGYSQLSIRGVSAGNSGTSATVATYFDNAPVGASLNQAFGAFLAPDLDPNDIASVEVLRGPQGTLYGANSLGGLLKYNLVKPDLNAVGGRVWLDINDVKNGKVGYAARGRVSVPLVEGKVAALISASTREDPGFISDSAQGIDGIGKVNVSSGRVSLLGQASETLQIQLSAMVNDRKIRGTQLVPIDPITIQPVFGELEQRFAPGTGNFDSRFYLYTANLDWALSDDITLVSTTSLNRMKVRNSADFEGFLPAGPGLATAITNTIRQRKFAQEVTLNVQSGEMLDIRVGGYYTRERGYVLQQLPTFSRTTGQPVAGPDWLNATTRSTYEEIAAFGEVDIHLSPRFDVTAGLRYAHNRQVVVQDYTGLFIPGGALLQRDVTKDSVATFSVSPSYKFDNDMMLYARVASGYRPGGYNLLAAPPFDTPFGADRTTNYELGLKGRIGPITYFDFTIFQIDWNNIQLPLPGAFQVITNVGSATSRGAELAVNLTPAQGLSLSGSLAYMDAEFDQAVTFGAAVAKGELLPYAPRWKGSVAINYEFDSGGNLTPFAGSALSFNSSQLANVVGNLATPRVRLPSFYSLDFTVGVRFDRFSLQAFVKNATDKRGYNSANAFLTGPLDPQAAGVQRPRTIGLSLIANM